MQQRAEGGAHTQAEVSAHSRAADDRAETSGTHQQHTAPQLGAAPCCHHITQPATVTSQVSTLFDSSSSDEEEKLLYVYVDASELCYAVAAYWRSALAAAKGRVAPLSITSVPRLELQAAVLGGRLARTVQEEHDRRPDRRVFWSDSRTVLAWLRAGARSFKPFVAHRVAELEETTAGAEWRWVPTAHNVADEGRDAGLHRDSLLVSWP